VIRLVVALPAEARPLIEHFALKSSGTINGRSVYARENIQLIVGGVGKAAAAAATALLYIHSGQERNRFWVNLGLAGHRHQDIGRCFLADRIEDPSSGNVWHPAPVRGLGIPTSTVRTVEDVEERYEGDALYEMEAAGFFAVASLLSRRELVQVFKIVSDGPSSPARRLTARRVSELVAAHVETVARLCRDGQSSRATGA
jgi:nucleoside phosphorylase